MLSGGVWGAEKELIPCVNPNNIFQPSDSHDLEASECTRPL